MRALSLPGTVYFAWESPVWTGGIAFYSPRAQEDWPRDVAACGYLFTLEQFEDLVAQEMYREPGTGTRIDLDAVLRDGSVRLGDGRYETVVCLGERAGYPVLTCTAPWDPATVELRRPATRYLEILAGGLRESHGWTAERIHAYLAGLPGVRGLWDTAELRALVVGE
ncbi:histone deacetylase [Nocardia vaccinii]|uniref:histone deacetylase n=1 Tax=Nocardia vaccinii TaxID=1822 RepID=UPI000A86F97B|nr:histone deacetylase [Nocardia vaccinii]